MRLDEMYKLIITIEDQFENIFHFDPRIVQLTAHHVNFPGLYPLDGKVLNHSDEA